MNQRASIVRLVISAIFALPIFFAVPSAEAATYKFTFTTSELLGAIYEGNPGFYSHDGYFSIFMQPLSSQLSDYDYVTLLNPKPGTLDTDGWTTAFVPTYLGPNPTPPPDFISNGYLGEIPPGSCGNYCAFGPTWAQFSKLDGQKNITLVSDPDLNGGNNIFISSPDGGPIVFTSNGTHPFDLASKVTITSLMSTSAVWAIELDIHNGFDPRVTPLTFIGRGSPIRSDFDDQFGFLGLSGEVEGEGKVVSNQLFQLSLYGTATPEPGTFVLFALGVFGIGILEWRRRRATA